MEYISLVKQLVREREINAALADFAAQNAADLEYIAMMCDVDLDPEEEPAEEV